MRKSSQKRREGVSEMAERCEIRLAGSGGQGLITAGIILAEAAVIDGNDAVQTQTYGAEARGGSSKAEVIISKDSITYPKVAVPDILLAMNKVSYLKYHEDIKEDALVIVDSYDVAELIPGVATAYLLPITDTAIEKTGREMTANIVAVGVLSALVDDITFDNLKKTVLKRVPRGTEDMNSSALEAGYALGTQVKKQHEEDRKRTGF